MASRIPGIIHEVEANDWTYKDAIRVARLIESAFTDTAVAGVAEETGIDLGIGAAAIASIPLDVVAAIVLLIALIVSVLLLLAVNTIGNQVRGIPLVGGPLYNLGKWLTGYILLAGSWIEIEAATYWRNFLLDLHKLIGFLIAALGLPSLSSIQHTVQRTGAALARLPYDVDALGRRIATSLYNDLMQVWHNINMLWRWIHSIYHALLHLQKLIHHALAQLHHVLIQVASLLSFMRWAFHYLQVIGHQIHTLFHDIHNLQHQVKTLQKEISFLHARLLADEEALAPALEGVAVLALLLPLLEMGEGGVENLVKLADDPCFCFSVPGSPANLLWVIVSDLVAQHGL